PRWPCAESGVAVVTAPMLSHTARRASWPEQIPCATEQGTFSTRTGNHRARTGKRRTVAVGAHPDRHERSGSPHAIRRGRPPVLWINRPCAHRGALGGAGHRSNVWVADIEYWTEALAPHMHKL